jgi:ELWxxDGT repeat protein
MLLNSIFAKVNRRPKGKPRGGRFVISGRPPSFETLEDRALLSVTPAALTMDINPGAPSSNPQNMAALGSTVLFAADDGAHGVELWKSDGTLSGTAMVKDINLGSTTSGGVITANSSNPTDLVTMGGDVYFAASDGADGTQLWKSDGTAAGTTMVTNLNAMAGGLSPSELLVVNGTLYFTADDGTDGTQIWKTDGTSAGVTMVSNLQPTTGTAEPANLTNVGGTIYFTANAGTAGTQLYKTDGTATGTRQVTALVSGGVGLSPTHLTDVNGTLFFVGYDTAHGSELWKSNGTAAGTVGVDDINPGAAGSNPTGLTNVSGTVYFAADDGTHGVQLWKSDGTPTGTVMVKDIDTVTAGASAYPANLVAGNGEIYFRANDGTHGTQLWQSDGTDSGTVMVATINPSLAGATPDNLVMGNGYVFFTANDGTHGYELWQSDGTSAGTALVTDIFPGANSSNPANLTVVGQTLFMAANDGTHGNELWAAPLPNARPVAQDNSYTFGAGVPLAVAAPGVLTGASDVDGDPLTAVLATSPAHGTLTLNADGSFSYTPDAGFDGVDHFTYYAFDGTNNSVRPATATLTSQDYRYVANLYTTVLGRAAGGETDGEIMYWVNQLATGTTRAQIAGDFVHSPEYDGNLVNGYFQQYLKRPADPTSLNYFVGEMAAGTSTNTVISQLLMSDEYFARSGNNAGFVWNLYNDLLGRDPAADEFAFWKQQLDKGVTRSQFVSVFVGSAEFDTMVVQRAYQQYLARPAEPQAITFWTGRMLAGISAVQDIDTALAASNEFYSRAA